MQNAHNEVTVQPEKTQVSRQKMIGSSGPTTQVRGDVELYAPRREPVLIVGESGVGKEVVAHLLHEKSDRNRGEEFCR